MDYLLLPFTRLFERIGTIYGLQRRLPKKMPALASVNTQVKQSKPMLINPARERNAINHWTRKSNQQDAA